MEIGIRIIDIIYLGIAFGGAILCIVLHFYDRHKTAKWLKENAMMCDKYDKCTKTDCGVCTNLDEKYSDLIVFDDRPKRQLESPEIHNE